MVEFYDKNRQLINKILFFCGCIIFVYVFINYLFRFVSPFVLGYVISLILNPVADYFDKKHRIHRGVVSFFLIVIFILLLVTIGTAIVSKIVNEINSFYINTPSLTEEIVRVINNLRSSISSLFAFFPDELQAGIDGILGQLTVTATSLLGSVVKTSSINIVTTVPGMFMNIVFGFVSTFFFVKDKYLFIAVLGKRAAFLNSGHFASVRAGLLTALGGYIKAMLTLMAVMASICILGLTIIGSQYAIIIGLLASFVDALPVFGLGAIFWPWILFSFLNNNVGQAVSLAVVYGVAFLTRQMLEPKILGQNIGIHPLLTLMSIYIGLKVFGVAGIILGPVTAITAKILFVETE